MTIAFQHPIHRTLAAVDMENYGRLNWRDPTRLRLWCDLGHRCDGVLAQASVDPEKYHRRSTGDGYLYSIDANVPRDVVLDRLVNGLWRQLNTLNCHKQVEDQVRVRVALHVGEVLADPVPLVGYATMLTCRLLDSEVLRACLRATSQPLVAIASQVLYDSIIWQRYNGIDPDEWHPVIVPTKEGPIPAWVHVPHDPTRPHRSGQAWSSRPTLLDALAVVRRRASRSLRRV
jgi:hypothetical protein